MKNFDKNHEYQQDGSILIYTIVMIFIFSAVMLGVLGYAAAELRVVRSTVNREQAFQIAEAGVNYYQWHLAHFTSDYWDGNASTTPGPYAHTYTDSDTGQVLGQFSLTITPPPVGSTVVTIQSKGSTNANPGQARTVTVRYGIPSLAQYAFLTNSDAWIGSTESVNGQFFTNGGVRFDGTGNAPIMSAKQTYTCQSWSGNPCPATENGVWGSAPQSTQNFWQFPVPNTDFSSITSNLSSIKTGAQQSGIYLAPSSALGYSLVFNVNGTVDVYKVTSLAAPHNGWDVNGNAHNTSWDYSGSGRTFLYNQAIPANGLIYAEDNTWVEGTVSGRVMVAAAKLPYNANTAPSIIVPNNIVYAAKDGTNSLGLLAQQDLLISYGAPNNLEIDAALVAQNGSTQNYYWPGDVKTGTIAIYGSTASYGVWTWSWVDNSNNIIGGYTNTNTVYDSNLLYSPPPSFPLTANGYQQISWTSN